MSYQAEIEVRRPRTTSSYAPNTFVERGVAVPFTTPQLGGARVRAGDRDLLELIVANPTGGRGVYIVPWSGVAAFCSPTLHDRTLHDRLKARGEFTPPMIRRQSLDTAQQGLAGRAAAAAARAARAAEARLVTQTNFELVQMLVQQVGKPPAGRADPADMQQRGRRAVVAVAATIGRSPDTVATKLEELAAVFAPLGVGEGAADARIAQILQALAALRSGIRAAMQAPPPTANPDAALVMAASELIAAAARAMVAEAMALLQDVSALLRSWVQSPDKILTKVERPEWLLDGWERIALIWQDEPRRSEALFGEMADLVPAIPREAAEWVALCGESPAGIMRARRGGDDGRSGPSLQDRIARNERLQARAMAVA